MLHSAFNPSPPPSFLAAVGGGQRGRGPVESGADLHGAPQPAALHHLVLAVVPLAAPSHPQPSDRDVGRVEIADLAAQRQRAVGRARDVGHAGLLDEACGGEVGTKMAGDVSRDLRTQVINYLDVLEISPR